MSTSGTYRPPAGAVTAEDFFRSANVVNKPDGTTDVTDAIVHQGRVGVGTFAVDPLAQFDVAVGARSGADGRVVGVTPLYITGNLPPIIGALATPTGAPEFRHVGQTQGVGVAYDGFFATGSDTNQHFTLMQRGTGVIRNIWQTAVGAVFDLWNQSAAAVGQGVQLLVRHTSTGTVAARHYLSVTETVTPLNVRQQFDITSNNSAIAALSIQPDMAVPTSTTLRVGGNQGNRRKIVIFDGSPTSNDNFFGIGMDPATMRYQIAGFSQFHRFYASNSLTTSQMLLSLSGVGNVTIDPDGLCAGGAVGPRLLFGAEGSGSFISSKRTAGGANNLGLELGTGNATRLAIKSGGLVNLSFVPTFTSDAAAGTGGLVAGDLYKSAVGVLSVKL